VPCNANHSAKEYPTHRITEAANAKRIFEFRIRPGLSPRPAEEQSTIAHAALTDTLAPSTVLFVEQVKCTCACVKLHMLLSDKCLDLSPNGCEFECSEQTTEHGAAGASLACAL